MARGIGLTTRHPTWHHDGMQLSSIRTSGQDRDRYAHKLSRDALVGTRTREQSRRREVGQGHMRRGIGSADSAMWTAK